MDKHPQKVENTHRVKVTSQQQKNIKRIEEKARYEKTINVDMCSKRKAIQSADGLSVSI